MTFAQIMRRREEAAEKGIEAQAREELADNIESGPNLWEALQSWLNVDSGLYNERLGLVAKHLQALLSGAELERDDSLSYQRRRENAYILARCEARDWLRPIIDAYITDDMVQNRVEELAAEECES